MRKFSNLHFSPLEKNSWTIFLNPGITVAGQCARKKVCSIFQLSEEARAVSF